MIAARIPRLRLDHALVAAATLFIALAVWPWLVPPVPRTPPFAPPQADTPAPAVAALPSLNAFGTIVERPLFSPSRRPTPGTAANGGSIESRYRLLGIVAAGPQRKAFIAEGQRRIEVAVGAVLDGWTVKEIAMDRLVLTSPAGEATLKLTQKAQ